MTAPAAGAVVEESTRGGGGATAADRDLEKLNALENWAHIQSSLENKQACCVFFSLFFLVKTRRETRTNQKCRPCEGEDDDTVHRERKERKRSGSSNLLLCVCLAGILFGAS